MLIMDRNKREAWRQTVLKVYDTEEEIWAFHPETEHFIISNKGRVKNFITGNLLKAHPNQQGYMMTNIVYSNGKRRSSMTHRLVAETFYAFFGLNDEIYEVNHIDGNKKNNNLSNLEWLTRYENLQHARDNKLFKPSKKILTNSDIKDIRELRSLGFYIREIATAYKIGEKYVSFLTNDKANEGKYVSLNL